MRPARVVIALLLAVVGAVWTLQGLGVIGGSAMSGMLFRAGAEIALSSAPRPACGRVRRRAGQGRVPDREATRRRIGTLTAGTITSG